LIGAIGQLDVLFVFGVVNYFINFHKIVIKKLLVKTS
jgi:hypothetical protein